MRALTGVLLLVLLIVSVALAGCGAGQLAQTSTMVSGVDGAVARSGQMLLRDAVFVYRPPVAGGAVYQVGDDPPLQFTLVNDGPHQDRLVGIRSGVAADFVIAGDTTMIGRQSLTAGYDKPLADVELPGVKEVEVRLLGLREPLKAGLTYAVTFDFQNTPPLTAQVPIAGPDAPRVEGDSDGLEGPAAPLR